MIEPEHHYLKKLRALIATGVLPPGTTACEVLVYHDAWCELLQDGGERCNCDPELRLA